MVSIDYADGKGWHNARVIPYGPIELDPSAIVLHYAQEVFEGLKAYRWADGSIVSFRPEANARRLRSSARRLAIPELPEEVFIESLRQLIAVDEPWVPPAGGEESLYLRPYIFATEPGLGVRPANEYRYLVIASPAGAYFKGGIKPVSVWLSTEYVRACPGGTGAAKFGGNYAASLLAQAQATENDCDQVVWLDATERRYVEEMGGMNLFFVFGSGGTARLVTPELSGSMLPGVTRDSLLQLATDAGFAVEERKIDVDEWQKKAAAGEITEVFACGTAAVITPVARVKLRRRRVHHRRRRAGRDHHGAARHADRHPARHVRRHPRLDGPAELDSRYSSWSVSSRRARNPSDTVRMRAVATWERGTDEQAAEGGVIATDRRVTERVHGFDSDRCRSAIESTRSTAPWRFGSYARRRASSRCGRGPRRCSTCDPRSGSPFGRSP